MGLCSLCSLTVCVALAARRHNSNISIGSVADELMSRGNAPLTPPSVEGYAGGINYGASSPSVLTS